MTLTTPKTPTGRVAGDATGRSLRGETRQAVSASLGRLKDAGDLWYIVAACVVNVANFAFFGLVGHLLGPSDYGADATLLNLVSVVSIPLNAVQAAVVQEVIRQTHDGVVPSVRRVGWVFVGSGLLAATVVSVASPLVGSFLGLGSVVPVLVLAVWLVPAIDSSLYDGVLIGNLRWRPIAASLIAGALVRVGFAALTNVAHLGIAGPVLATTLNAAVTLGVVLWVFVRTNNPTGPRLVLPTRTLTHTILALTGYSAFVAVDTFVARHVLRPAVSGNYAAAVTIGRIAMYLPMAITVIMFPRFVSRESQGVAARRLLLVGLAAVMTLGLLTAGVIALVPHLAVDILFGHRYSQAASITGTLSVEGAILGGIGLVTYFALARRSLLSAAPAVATVTVGALEMWLRLGPVALARLMVGSAFLLLVVMTLGLVWRRERPVAGDEVGPSESTATTAAAGPAAQTGSAIFRQ